MVYLLIPHEAVWDHASRENEGGQSANSVMRGIFILDRTHGCICEASLPATIYQTWVLTRLSWNKTSSGKLEGMGMGGSHTEQPTTVRAVMHSSKQSQSQNESMTCHWGGSRGLMRLGQHSLLWTNTFPVPMCSWRALSGVQPSSWCLGELWCFMLTYDNHRLSGSLPQWCPCRSGSWDGKESRYWWMGKFCQDVPYLLSTCAYR